MLQDVMPQIECVESSDIYGRFVAEPLKEGEGITLGNALRRVLLSSLPGAAVTWVRIEGIFHEFSTIPHMKEDATEFMLNVKALRLRPLSSQPGQLILDVAREGQVTAADIEPSSDFEIVNPELHLATLDSPEARLVVEFNVEIGKGYVPAGSSNGQLIGVIPVDAIFTPVRKVNYTTEPTRIGQGTKQERLILEVWTDRTITPVEAIAKSAESLAGRFSLFAELAQPAKRRPKQQLLTTVLPPEQYNLPLEQIGFSIRTYNCLKRGNINTLGEVLEKSEEELMALRHFGDKSRQEVKERLQAMGLFLRSMEKEAAPQEEAEKLAQEEETGE